jgi:ABC-type uncharacterized transport system permease subunit
VRQRLTLQLAAPALALIVAVVVSAVLLQVTDNDPGRVFSVILEGASDRRVLVETINRAAPYYISGVAVAIGFKMNLFNIGTEGQYKIAALVASWAGATVDLPAPAQVTFMLLVAVTTGALWGLIPGILKAFRGVSEVISSIMLNAVATGFGAFMLQRWFKDESAVSTVLGTEPVPSSARLPDLNGLVAKIGIDLPSANRLQSYLFVALLVGIAYHVVIWRTRFGYDLRATGANPEAAEASGVNARRMILTTMVLSGGTAGLIGLNNVMGPAGRYTDVAVVSGLGFTGIAIALLGRNHPVGIAFGALLWAFMDAVQTPLSNAELPKQITAILQGVTVLSVVIAYEVVRRVGVRREAWALRRATTGAGDVEGVPA